MVNCGFVIVSSLTYSYWATMSPVIFFNLCQSKLHLLMAQHSRLNWKSDVIIWNLRPAADIVQEKDFECVFLVINAYFAKWRE